MSETIQVVSDQYRYKTVWQGMDANQQTFLSKSFVRSLTMAHGISGALKRLHKITLILTNNEKQLAKNCERVLAELGSLAGEILNNRKRYHRARKHVANKKLMLPAGLMIKQLYVYARKVFAFLQKLKPRLLARLVSEAYGLKPYRNYLKYAGRYVQH